MNEDKTVNQDPISQEKIVQLGKELDQIEAEAAQTTPVNSEQPRQETAPVKPPETVMDEKTSPQGLKHSKGIFWTAIVLLILAFAAAGIFFLQL